MKIPTSRRFIIGLIAVTSFSRRSRRPDSWQPAAPSTAAALVALAEALREVPERETDAWQIRRGQSAAFEAALLLMSWSEA